MAGEKYLPFTLSRMVLAPGHSPHVFKAVFAAQAIYEKGILEKIARCFEENDASILALESSALPDGRNWIYIAADLGEGGADPIASCLSGIEHTVDVDYAPPPAPGVGVDAWGFPPIMGGTRMLAVRKPILEEFLRRGWRLMGGGFGILLYHTFFKAGQEIYRSIYSKLAGDHETQIRLAEAVFRIAGYGVTRVTEFTHEKAVVRVYDSLECESLGGVEEAESSIVRGIVAGFVAALWGLGINDVTARETRCIRRGDPHCEIVIERKAQRAT